MTTAPATFRPFTAPATFVPPSTDRAPSAVRPAVGDRLSGLPVGVGALVAIGAIVLAHLLTLTSVDPVRATLSTYGISEGSSVLFAISCLSLAAATAGLARRLPRPGRLAAYATSVMLALVVIFPTDPGDGVPSLTAQIHRYAAGAAFVLLLLVIGSAAGMCPPAVRRTIRAGIVLTVLMLGLTIAATFWPDLLQMQQWRGVPQRILLLVEAASIAALGFTVAGAGRSR